MTVAFAIQTHPVRLKRAAVLAERVGGRVVVDPDPNGRPCAWRSYRECLTGDWRDASHLCVLQDDTAPCDHLPEIAAVVAARHPDALVCFYVGGMPRHHRNEVLAACGRGERYCAISTRQWVPVVATMWPVGLARSCAEWVAGQRWALNMIADDEAVGRWARQHHASVIATVPSLVQHPDDEPSLVSGFTPAFGRNASRCAAVMVCDGCDARTYDWAT